MGLKQRAGALLEAQRARRGRAAARMGAIGRHTLGSTRSKFGSMRRRYSACSGRYAMVLISTMKHGSFPVSSVSGITRTLLDVGIELHSFRPELVGLQSCPLYTSLHRALFSAKPMMSMGDLFSRPRCARAWGIDGGAGKRCASGAGSMA